MSDAPPGGPAPPRSEHPHPDPADARPLLTGAGPVVADFDLEAVSRVCRDASLPVARRLEALEDLMEAQVGDTVLTRARNLERSTGLRQVWLKFEGENPTGTQKDRIAFAQAADALHRGFEAITVATCGNYGVATALAASAAGLKCAVVVPVDYHTQRVVEMASFGAEILREGATYEDAVAASQRLAAERGWYDANPGGDNEIVQLRAYAELAFEIYDELRDAPAAVACPMSNGTTIAGLHRGFASLYRRGKTSRVPRMIGGSALRQNPIVVAWERGLPRCPELVPGRLRETAVNEPLINWRSIDGDTALAAIRSTDGFAAGVTDGRMKQMARRLRDQQALSVLPASTAGLLALLDLHARAPLPPDRYVVILTGRSS